MILNITVKENHNQEVNLFLDDKNIGLVNGEFNKEIDINEKKGIIHFTYNDKKSLPLKLDNKEEIYLEIDKAFNLNNISFLATLRIIIPLFLMCFCFHKAAGIGYYIFGVVIVLFTVIFFLNKDKLMFREVKK